jgi:hypothetical protein
MRFGVYLPRTLIHAIPAGFLRRTAGGQGAEKPQDL